MAEKQKQAPIVLEVHDSCQTQETKVLPAPVKLVVHDSYLGHKEI
jgi:hypothetical protein